MKRRATIGLTTLSVFNMSNGGKKTRAVENRFLSRTFSIRENRWDPTIAHEKEAVLLQRDTIICQRQPPQRRTPGSTISKNVSAGPEVNGFFPPGNKTFLILQSPSMFSLKDLFFRRPAIQISQ